VIARSPNFNLGLDVSRIKDPNDGLRQEATVDELLSRFFGKQRQNLQVLADEVGMGKTFVALGVAWSILEHLKRSVTLPDLAQCYQRILVLTPANESLFNKWVREVAEFRRRCFPSGFDSNLCFEAASVNRLDDLAAELRKPGRQPQVIVARLSNKLGAYELKRRMLLGVLFRKWGSAFSHAQRERLLRGAPFDWPRSPDELTELTEQESALLAFSEEELRSILENFDSEERQEEEALLARCREVSEPFFRDRAAAFAEIKTRLINIYKIASARSIRRNFPLVIVDEAHHWKNGPRGGANSYWDFERYIAPHTRRLLLLTATPFQLRPDEMLEILKAGAATRPAATIEKSRERTEQHTSFCTERLKPALKEAEARSHAFGCAWGRIPARFTTAVIGELWESKSLVAARRKLADTLQSDAESARICTTAIAEFDPDVRPFLREALQLFAANRRLSWMLGTVLIRHRRRNDHRLFRVGAECGDEAEGVRSRSDRHLLHAAPGIEIRGEGELPQYLLMRCVSEMKGGRGRASLGSDLTGCYSTLLGSAEGRAIKEKLGDSPEGKLYLQMLLRMVGEKEDRKHPKVDNVVTRVEQLWEAGEKVLIFCFRVNTAERLHHLISERISTKLKRSRSQCLGGEAQLRALRGRLSGRTRDLVTLGLDRVLWSCLWARGEECPFAPEDFILRDTELDSLATLAITFDVTITGEREDRVFLHRATEHLVAKRLLTQSRRQPWDSLLRAMADESWVSHPYGFEASADDDDGGETTSFDERGVHTVYVRSCDPEPVRVRELASALRHTRDTARSHRQIPLIDAYALGANLWLGSNPMQSWSTGRTEAIGRTQHSIHAALWNLSGLAKEHDFKARALIVQAMRRVILRESVLVRLLPSRRDRDEAGWGELLAEAFTRNLRGQSESMADRIAALLEDIEAASGDLHDPKSARASWLSATRLRDQQFVALVKGGGGGTAMQTRERVLAGFNTPLLPEVLICTAVGQEGIDLHRHCRHVIHYDLAWNPAVIEQRTGRADRIGSKTFRERALASYGSETFLEIAVPFLAATYDERMFEELRLRAQTFEVLTGGDFAADHTADDSSDSQPGDEIGLHAVALPSNLSESLRVDLHVWLSPIPRQPPSA
jgi:hypothetical protein